MEQLEKWNDQIRFELNCYNLYFKITILAPWRKIEFYNGILIFATAKELWNTDKLVHIRRITRACFRYTENFNLYSYESRILEDPAIPVPKGHNKMIIDPIYEEIEISFKKGYPINVKSLKDPLAIIEYLNEIGDMHRLKLLMKLFFMKFFYIFYKIFMKCIKLTITIFVQFQSRGIYESSDVNILKVVHLTDKIYQITFNGLFISRRFLEYDFVLECIQHSQRYVNDTSIVNATEFIRTQALKLKEFYRFNKQHNVRIKALLRISSIKDALQLTPRYFICLNIYAYSSDIIRQLTEWFLKGLQGIAARRVIV
ncbi:ASSY synthase, partial [Acromyrmex insinuator]